MEVRDLSGVLELQRQCFPEPFPADLLWTEEHLTRHLEIFPEGQFVAVSDGKVVGSASSALISESTWQAHLPWEETLGGFFFAGHDPTGRTLYGADISVHPAVQGRGVGRTLYAARFDYVRRLGLVRFGTACRIPGYAAWANATGLSPDEYVQAVIANEVSDRTLTPLLRYGLSFLQVLENYMEDEESLDCAALLERRPENCA